jgi:hypothetical protein
MPRNYSGLPWKRNFRKVPRAIEARMATFSSNKVVVACSKILTDADIERGTYQHLDIGKLADLGLEFESLIPSPNVGRASFYNATDVERPDKTHGMIYQTRRARAPNWKGRGSHATITRRKVWPRKLLVPSMSHIAFKRIGQSASHGEIVVLFQVQELINTSDPEHRERLLRCLNLLQENVGKVDLFELNAEEAEFIRRASEEIGWELLPDVDRQAALKEMARKLGARRPELGKKMQDRFEIVQKLYPKQIHHGTRGFSGYFAVEFTENLVWCPASNLFKSAPSCVR